MKTLVTSQYLDMAYKYADDMSGCRKVAVGSVIAKDGLLLSFGANKAIPTQCSQGLGSSKEHFQR